MTAADSTLTSSSWARRSIALAGLVAAALTLGGQLGPGPPGRR
jgi:hypothetical protein